MTFNSDDSLAALVEIYFGQESSFYGDSVEEIITAYLSDGPIQSDDALIDDIRSFQKQNAHDIEGAFKERFSFDLDPTLWGFTAQTLLEKIVSLVLDARPQKLERELGGKSDGVTYE